ncbi:MAG: hypothetical protein UU73_C0005G0002 [Candidatus Daviesbacteria bacterium GW2011_GWA1_41_61]|uniref:Peptidase M50 domain-containing protein n=1 Tax=Candidatus Daviesbacteria bacterium GW2011_GWA2_40_9 TaxID=1618424 RepID=A0A0G0U3P1_9BACT|nr:MAG: hypothetical protein UU26_C0012G0026 [Candidatus Daviesbacteria bacterium GW2011_GWC1_40_9]KKR83669.1 MAG: hypothetical protein UU29_C0003G0071 [Candidatus Daviesbacteria bacterium GW2011_GWA2_40_9]KKR92672.1 MAG: hypothetical protein UU44_C0005G0002 [Candidatus Daviesbacteria bacterium GW2011_GWB1_41_15]KKS14603.1 MAG: hypothetical protein UU73_C0005G0002 [Candidatus Daviesbacteria bacterium GW2011_GWA1_41_61]
MDPAFLSLSIVILLFSVILHEVMHGFTALKFGDRTAELAGRLTLNPLPHIDPIGTVLVPMLGFLPVLLGGGPGFIIGWAKPVPVNPLNFSDIRRGELLVSLAGVAANFALAVLGAFLFHLAVNFAPNTNISLINVLRFTVTINLILGVFNLLPIPPLDGSKVVLSFLPYKLAARYQSLEKYGLLIIFALWFISIGGVSLLSLILGTAVGILGSLLNVPLRLF